MENDFEIKEGGQYILDEQFDTSGVVTIVKVHGKHFVDVKDEFGNQWTTMRYRLSPNPTSAGKEQDKQQ